MKPILSNLHIKLGKLAIVLALLLIGGQAWGATYYVSPTGDDGAAGSEAAPWATIGKAVVVTGDTTDTVIFENGTYNTADGANGTTNFRTRYSITWKARNAGQVIWKANHATGVVYAQPNASKTPVIDGIVIDATGTQQAANCLYADSAMTTTTITLKNIALINFTTAGFNAAVSGYSLYVENSSAISTNFTAGYAFRCSGLSAGVISIDGLALTMASNVGSTEHIGVYINALNSSAVTATVKNLTGTLANTGANTTMYGVYVRNVNSAEISGCNFTISSNSSSLVSGFRIGNTGATLTANGGKIINNTINFLCSVGYAISIRPTAIGTDADNNSNNGEIYGNTVTGIENGQTGTPHGISLANNTGGVVYNNRIINFSPALLASKTDNTTIIISNIVTHPYGAQQLYAKGANGTLFAQNTVKAETGYNGACIAMQVHEDTTTNNSGVLFTNNLCENSSANPVFVRSEADQTGTFANNLYYGSQSLIATSWKYGGSNYNSFAAPGWQAVEASAVWGDPLLSATYTLGDGSPAIGSGALITGLHDQATPATDIAGTAVTWGPSIGAYQPTPANVIYFDKSAAAGGNGTQSTPYNDMASYPVAKLISGTVANPLYIYLKGDFSAEALDFSAYGGPADPYVIIRTPKLNQAANLGALTEKGSNMTLQYYQSVQALPAKVWSDFTQYTTVP